MLMRSTQLKPRRSGERGAALVTTLLVSALLLTAGGALILSTTMTGLNTFDSAAESQAYYGAEAGLQAALNVLRGNSQPLQGTTKITFDNALDLPVSNLDSDTSTVARLSRWLPYSTSYPDRVAVNPNYTPFNGIAYKVEVSNPDPSGLKRMIVKSTGFASRGAVKVLSIMISPRLHEIKPPGLLTIRGADVAHRTTHFKLGKPTDIYSGIDAANPLSAPIPIFALVDDDMTALQKKIDKASPTFNTEPVMTELTTGNMPGALRSATSMYNFLNRMEAYAKSQNRYFKKEKFSGPADGFTFLDAKGGSVVVDGGSGVLIVTGDVRLRKAAEFRGLIIVAGGKLDRDDSGKIYGAVVIADVNRKRPQLGFRKAHYHAGDNQLLQYDSDALNMAMRLGGFNVIGVTER